jgi:hypothetical protein
LTLLANDHAVFDADRRTLAELAGIGQVPPVGNSSKGGMASNFDITGTYREVVGIFYIGVNPARRNLLPRYGS